jgi:hypothetical protein
VPATFVTIENTCMFSFWLRSRLPEALIGFAVSTPVYAMTPPLAFLLSGLPLLVKLKVKPPAATSEDVANLRKVPIPTLVGPWLFRIIEGHAAVPPGGLMTISDPLSTVIWAIMKSPTAKPAGAGIVRLVAASAPGVRVSAELAARRAMAAEAGADRATSSPATIEETMKAGSALRALPRNM